MRTLFLLLATLTLAAAGPRPTPPAARDAEIALTMDVMDVMRQQPDAPNMLALRRARPALAAALRARLCTRDSAISQARGAVTDWVGAIVDVEPASYGHATLTVSLVDGLMLSAGDDLPIGDGVSVPTTLAPGTPAFALALTLRPGEEVAFSGTFFPSRDTCLLLADPYSFGMTPDVTFLFRFDTLKRGADH